MSKRVWIWHQSLDQAHPQASCQNRYRLWTKPGDRERFLGHTAAKRRWTRFRSNCCKSHLAAMGGDEVWRWKCGADLHAVRPDMAISQQCKIRNHRGSYPCFAASVWLLIPGFETCWIRNRAEGGCREDAERGQCNGWNCGANYTDAGAVGWEFAEDRSHISQDRPDVRKDQWRSPEIGRRGKQTRAWRTTAPKLCAVFPIFTAGCQHDVDQTSKFVAETQTDFRMRDQKIEDLEKVTNERSCVPRTC